MRLIEEFSMLNFIRGFDRSSMGRVVKVDQNPWINPAYHDFESGWVETFLQILV